MGDCRRGGRCSPAVWCWLLVFVELLTSGCASQPKGEGPDGWEAWRQRRLTSVAGTNGWATLVGLQWLKEGTNQLELPGPSGPVNPGIVVRRGKQAWFESSGTVPVQFRGRPVLSRNLKSDDGGAAPDILVCGTVRFFLIQRGDRLGVRMKDPEAAARREFHGLEYFPYASGWRITGTFEPSSESRTLPIADVTGVTQPEPCPGRLRFVVDGQVRYLDALVDDETGEFFVLFRDATSGKSTYGSGRFLHVAREDAVGRVVLDFNYAYNPPCSFTPFATCPLPPRQNWLPFSVEAGERSYRGTAH